MKNIVAKFIYSCLICQQTKYMTTKQLGLLQRLPILVAPWTKLSMDFIIGLLNSAGYTTMLVVVDRLTKVAHFSPLKLSFTAKSVA